MNFISWQAAILVAIVLILHRYFLKKGSRGILLTIVSVGFIFFQTPYKAISFLDALISLGTMALAWRAGNAIHSKTGPARTKAIRNWILLLITPLIFFKLVITVVPMHIVETVLIKKLHRFEGLSLVPIGLSYFTFRAIAYLVEIHRGRQEPVSLPKVFYYLAFWPTYLSGPIERPQPFFSQLEEDRRATSEDLAIGASRILSGLWKKLVLGGIFFSITSPFMNLQLANIQVALNKWEPWQLWVCCLSYYFYLYFDFSGYSDIAIGVSRLFGYKICENFNWPILASNISDFWRRWHMSLTSWVFDYIYIPMGGNRLGMQRAALNTVVAMLIIALWHGLNAHYFQYGLYQASLLIIYRLWRKNWRRHFKPSPFPKVSKFLGWLVTLISFDFGFVLFIFDSHRAMAIYAKMLGLG